MVIHWRTRWEQGKVALLDPPHQVIWAQGGGPLHSGLTPVTLPLLEILTLSEVRQWQRLWARVQIQQAQASFQIGLSDPAQTGRLWGLLASLPPQWPLQIQLSFTQNGWRSCGKLDLRWQRWGIALVLTQIWVGEWRKRRVREQRT